MTSIKLFGLALGATLALSTTAFAQDINVAVAGPMTGSEAAFGRQLANGADLAVADLNAAGGVLGKKLVLQTGDDACDPKQARSVAEKLASAKVPFVAGHFCSSSSIPASEAYADGNVLQITPASTNPLFTERKLWNVLRICGRDDQQGGVAAEYILKHFKGKNIAILNDKTTYGKGLADETKKALNKAGVQEKIFESYNKGDKDFNSIVSRLKRENIDLVYIGGYYLEAGLILRQMRDQGLKTVMMAGDAMNDREFASITGPLAAGTLFTFGPDPRNKPTAKAIVEKFKAKNVDPEGYTLYTYAAFQVWSQAATKAGTTDPKKVMAAIKAGEWDTVLGKLSFDAKGDIKMIDYVVYKWDDKGNYAEVAAENYIILHVMAGRVPAICYTNGSYH
ncbi:MAG: branched-chain amino acid ABC transporter substrate-binding protein [Rhodopseudomonas palustris]|nr:branched-chain amino acid ABC transporter substrate-binding protein [Rhodopseudomonas palustris]